MTGWSSRRKAPEASLLISEREPGQEDMAGRFQTALEEEDRHLASLRASMEQICLNEAGVQ